MADYSMDDEAWNAKKADIDEWFEANPDYSDRQQITNGLFAIGDIQTDFRKRHWSSIAGVFSELSNSPIGRGRAYLMDVTDRSNLDNYCHTLGISAGDFYDVAHATLKTHGKSGGLMYNTMEDGRSAYVDETVSKARTWLSKGINAQKANNADVRYWVSFDSDGSPVVTDNGASTVGGEEE